jgi:hypothetical protein
MAVTVSRLKDFVETIPSGGMVVRLAYNANNDVEYAGYAPPGSANDSAIWRITKFYYDGSLMSGQRYADGNLNYDNVWINRDALSYS